MLSPLFVPGLNDIVVAVNGILLRDGRRGGMTSDVVSVSSVGQLPNCAISVLCWPMRGKIFCW